MIDPDEIKRLVQPLQSSGVTVFEYKGPQGSLRLHFATSQIQASQVQAVAAAPEVIAARTVLRSPGMGRLRLRHPLAGDVLIRTGATVLQGEIVALLDANGILVPVKADRKGVVARVLADEGALVGYASPLLEWA